MNGKPPREITKNITVLMPYRPGRAEEGAGQIVITVGNQPYEEAVTLLRLCILKYREIEYILTKRIGALTLDDAAQDRHLPADGRLPRDGLQPRRGEPGQGQEQRHHHRLHRFKQLQVLLRSMNVIYEMALRNVLRPELILLGELESVQQLEERIGFYLSHYTLLNVERADGDEIDQAALQVARNVRQYPMDGYDSPLPELLRTAIDRGADRDLEDGLKKKIAEVIVQPPRPPYMTQFIEQLDPQKLVSTSICYLPSSVVKVTFSAQTPGQDVHFRSTPRGHDLRLQLRVRGPLRLQASGRSEGQSRRRVPVRAARWVR